MISLLRKLFLILLAGTGSGCSGLTDLDEARAHLSQFRQAAEEIGRSEDLGRRQAGSMLTLYSHAVKYQLLDSIPGLESSKRLMREGLVEQILLSTGGDICFNTFGRSGAFSSTRAYLLYHPESEGAIGDFVTGGIEIEEEVKLDSGWTYFVVRQSHF